MALPITRPAQRQVFFWETTTSGACDRAKTQALPGQQLAIGVPETTRGLEGEGLDALQQTTHRLVRGDATGVEPGHVGVITEEMLTQVTDRLLKGKIDEALYATIPAKVCACASLLLRACTS